MHDSSVQRHNHCLALHIGAVLIPVGAQPSRRLSTFNMHQYPLRSVNVIRAQSVGGSNPSRANHHFRFAPVGNGCVRFNGQVTQQRNVKIDDVVAMIRNVDDLRRGKLPLGMGFASSNRIGCVGENPTSSRSEE